jgi:hypothetical protein
MQTTTCQTQWSYRRTEHVRFNILWYYDNYLITHTRPKSIALNKVYNVLRILSSVSKEFDIILNYIPFYFTLQTHRFI